MPRANDFVQQLNTQFSTMQAQRAPYDKVWQQVAVFESERMNMFAGRSSLRDDSFLALHRDPRDVDNTARQAISIFSSGMLSGVSPPSDQWFSLKIAHSSGGPDLGKNRNVAEYMEALEMVFMRDFIAKNFYTQQVSSYKHIGMYGIQAMFIGDAPDIGTYYRDIPVDEIYVANDFAGRVNCVFREMFITVQQAIALFELKNLSNFVQNQVKSRDFNPNSKIRVVHAVYKKDPGFENIIGNNQLPYASFYFEPGEEHLISEGGFESLPYIVTRAYSDGRSPYSISPGTIALADVMMVNEVKKLILQAGQLSVLPPMLMPDRGLLGPLDYRPGAMNPYRKDSATSVNDYVPLKMVGDYKMTMELLQQAQKDINTAFFVDLFLMIHNRTQGADGKGTPTATEIQQLATEKSFLLAPILINQQQENFNRLFERVYELKKKVPGALPPLPSEMRNVQIDIEYISPLVRAQQSVQTNQILQSISDMVQIAQAYPDIIDIVDGDMVARKILDNRGMPMSCIRTLQEVAQMRAQKQQQQQQMQQQMQNQQDQMALMQGYKNLSGAPQQGSPAAALMQVMGGAGTQPG